MTRDPSTILLAAVPQATSRSSNPRSPDDLTARPRPPAGRGISFNPRPKYRARFPAVAPCCTAFRQNLSHRARRLPRGFLPRRAVRTVRLKCLVDFYDFHAGIDDEDPHRDVVHQRLVPLLALSQKSFRLRARRVGFLQFGYLATKSLQFIDKLFLGLDAIVHGLAPVAVRIDGMSKLRIP